MATFRVKLADPPNFNTAKQRRELFARLKTDGFKLVETTDDGWRVYESTAAPRKAPVRQVSGFAAFCKPRLTVKTKPLTFLEVLAREGIHLHPTGCWCPRHNQPKKAKVAA